MTRRAFIAFLGGAAAWPFEVRAQRPATPVVGFVNSTSPGIYPPVSAFLKGLSEAGFVEGRDVVVEYRWAEGHYERLPALMADLVQRRVSVIAATSTPAAVVAKTAVTTLPVVFTTSADPVQLGLVSNVSKPEGNLTGATQLNAEVAPKRLELMHEAIPTATHMALLVNSPDPMAAPVSRDTSAAAEKLGIKLDIVHAGNDQDLGTVFESLAQSRAEALVIGSDPFFSRHSEELAQLAARYRLPAIYQYPGFTAAGGLMSYGGSDAEAYRMAGGYVGRILKGEKPSNLPIQEVTKVELFINLKTAKTLGISLPIPLLGRADAVTE
jgi:putative tryptophan/tyrosine transport system substrate-binding protein